MQLLDELDATGDQLMMGGGGQLSGNPSTGDRRWPFKELNP